MFCFVFVSSDLLSKKRFFGRLKLRLSFLSVLTLFSAWNSFVVVCLLRSVKSRWRKHWHYSSIDILPAKNFVPRLFFFLRINDSVAVQNVQYTKCLNFGCCWIKAYGCKAWNANVLSSYAHRHNNYACKFSFYWYIQRRNANGSVWIVLCVPVLNGERELPMTNAMHKVCLYNIFFFFHFLTNNLFLFAILVNVVKILIFCFHRTATFVHTIITEKTMGRGLLHFFLSWLLMMTSFGMCVSPSTSWKNFFKRIFPFITKYQPIGGVMARWFVFKFKARCCRTHQNCRYTFKLAYIGWLNRNDGKRHSYLDYFNCAVNSCIKAFINECNGSYDFRRSLCMTRASAHWQLNYFMWNLVQLKRKSTVNKKKNWTDLLVSKMPIECVSHWYGQFSLLSNNLDEKWKEKINLRRNQARHTIVSFSCVENLCVYAFCAGTRWQIKNTNISHIPFKLFICACVQFIFQQILCIRFIVLIGIKFLCFCFVHSTCGLCCKSPTMQKPMTETNLSKIKQFLTL